MTEGHKHILRSPVVECVVKTECGVKRTRDIHISSVKGSKVEECCVEGAFQFTLESV